MSIFQDWIDAKEAEKAAQDARREIEDKLISQLNVLTNMEGTFNHNDPSGYNVKIVGRMNRKVDSDKIQELAAEHGLTDHLASLFRWKPEIIMAAWKAASPDITTPLLGGITTTPGRPSFTITKGDN